MDRYEQVLSTIREMIDSGAVAADGRLPTERQLCDDLDVGRRTLRRALDALEQEGRVYRRQGSGTFASGPSYTPAAHREVSGGEDDYLALAETATPVELIEMRLALEPIMCRLAALRSSRLDVERLKGLAGRTEKAKSYDDYEAADRAFHKAIAEFSRNTLFLKLQSALGSALRQEALARFGESGHCFKRQSEHVAFHHRIVAAIEDHDASLAERLMHEHLSDVHRSLFENAMPTGAMTRRVADAAE